VHPQRVVQALCLGAIHARAALPAARNAAAKQALQALHLLRLQIRQAVGSGCVLAGAAP
jgi:hypothetical protein